jgi:hypothetical protein
MVAPQPHDDWKDVPQANEKHERHAGNRRADPRRGGDLGQDDIDITGEPEGQRYRGTSDKPASHAMHLLGILSREDDAVIGGGRNRWLGSSAVDGFDEPRMAAQGGLRAFTILPARVMPMS